MLKYATRGKIKAFETSSWGGHWNSEKSWIKLSFDNFSIAVESLRSVVLIIEHFYHRHLHNSFLPL
jgi:hypothetical protein